MDNGNIYTIFIHIDTYIYIRYISKNIYIRTYHWNETLAKLPG